MVSLSQNIMQNYNSFYQAKLVPAKTGGTNTGNVVYSDNLTNYYIYRMRPKDEYIRTIDDFFSRFRL